MLALIAVGQVLGLTLWFSATAAAPAIAEEFRLTSTGSAWLTIAVQAGFVAGTLASALFAVADLVNPRWLFALGCGGGSLFNAAITTAESETGILALRFCTGAALACVYPPGLKIAAGWFLDRRGSALGVVVGALTLGSALPHLLAWLATDVPWRTLILASSALALCGGALVAASVRDGPHVAPSSPFDPRAVARVLQNRGARLAILGYLGHMWELYAMWAWIPAYAAASLASAGVDDPGTTGSLAGFVAIAAGAAGCVVAGRWADRLGKARVARAAMVISAASAASAPAIFGGPPALLFALAAVWGFAVVADSAQFSALVSESCPRTHVGTALTLQICAGFLLTMVSMQLLPIAAHAVGWRWAFLLLVPGPALGAWIMGRLGTGRSVAVETVR